MRRLLLAAALSAGLLVPSGAWAQVPVAVETPAPLPASADFYPSAYLDGYDSYNCADFVSQADAQAVLRADPADPNGLDRDRDGLACESRPLPSDLAPVMR